jgi:hypothetical protein
VSLLRRRPLSSGSIAAIGGALALSAALAVGSAPTVSAGTDPLPIDADGTCPRWSASTVAAGFGMLEKLAFDGRGGVLLAETGVLGEGALHRLAADGGRSVLASDLPAPGGIVLGPREVFVTTGNSALPGLFGVPDGTVQAIDVASGTRREVAAGLAIPSGLAQLPGGDLVVSSAFGYGAALSRIAPAGGARPTPFAPGVPAASGLAFDAGRNRLVASASDGRATKLYLVDASAADAAAQSVAVPIAAPGDIPHDVAVGPDGIVYLALFSSGRVLAVNPDAGVSCVIADNVGYPSGVEFGAGPGWDSGALYATGYDGTVRKLTPPREAP